MLRILTVACTGILLAACSREKSVETPTLLDTPLSAPQSIIDYAEFAEPANAYLAEIYNRSCISCHSVDGAGAPLTGHVDEWQRRLALRGEAGLLVATMKGQEGMPAMGMCSDCSDEDFQNLIAFMMAKK